MLGSAYMSLVADAFTVLHEPLDYVSHAFSEGGISTGLRHLLILPWRLLAI